MDDKEKEKKRLIKALLVSTAMIILLCIFPTLFAISISSTPEYTEEEIRFITTFLDKTTWTFDKANKTRIEELFKVKNIENASFIKSEYGIDLLLSDGRTRYAFPFQYSEGQLKYMEIILFLTEEEKPALLSTRSEILEFL